MAMTLQDFKKSGCAREIPIRFETEREALSLLKRISFPRTRLPTFETAELFWEDVFQLLDGGIIDTGFEALVGNAREIFPYNPVFLAALAQVQGNAATAPPTPQQLAKDRACTGSHIIVRGNPDVAALIDNARLQAQSLGISGQINLGVARDDQIILELPDTETQVALSLGQALTREFRTRGQTIQTEAVSINFRDYLLASLNVEGPDSARFELNNVPASTTVGQVAQTVMAQYDDGILPRDRHGKPRATVIDHIADDGTTRRLPPNQTLHEAGIAEGANLQTASESTAGALHIQVVQDALRRVKGQVLSYRDQNPGFSVSANSQTAPTEYLFTFSANSLAPSASGGPPVVIHEHSVYLLLPSEFPVQAPLVYWQTPIFHPNVDPKSGKVCLGQLADHYQPGMEFAKLCQLIVDIASFRNYEVREGYNTDAQNWLKTLEGQAVISQFGGSNLFSRLIEQPKVTLRIRRCPS